MGVDVPIFILFATKIDKINPIFENSTISIFTGNSGFKKKRASLRHFLILLFIIGNLSSALKLNVKIKLQKLVFQKILIKKWSNIG